MGNSYSKYLSNSVNIPIDSELYKDRIDIECEKDDNDLNNNEDSGDNDTVICIETNHVERNNSTSMGGKDGRHEYNMC